MNITLRTDWTVADICKGFNFDKNEGKGLFGLDGKLTIQPGYQRSYLYDKDGRDKAVIDSLINGYPLGLVYFVLNKDGMYEVLDGQQRITSFCRYVTQSYQFAVDIDGNPHYFDSLDKDLQDKILNTPIIAYICEGDPSEIQAWFKVINTMGIPLKKQELRNAAYYGPFVTAARAVFSNPGDSRMNHWKAYVKGDPRRQDILETALDWVGDGNIEDYMADHRYDTDITEIQNHFDSVISWIDSVFDYTGDEMCGVDWGRLYTQYHGKPYSKPAVMSRVNDLMEDPQVTDKKGIFEFVLGGETEFRLLNIRVFDKKMVKAVYKKQTADAKILGVSNCPLCAISAGNNATKIWEEKDMDADHVTAWSNGGATNESNCQMLCKTHNRAKGNR